MSRNTHTLSKRNNYKLPYRIAFLDTETTMRKMPDGADLHTLKTGYCCVCHRTKDNKLPIDSDIVINSADQFWQWLLRKVSSKHKLIIVCHNITYDATVLDAFTKLPLLGFKLASLYKQGVVGFFTFHKKSAREAIVHHNKRRHKSKEWVYDTTEIQFIDNGNFFSGKLEKWADIVARPKLSINFDNCTDQELEIYNKNDVLIMRDLWELWLSFLSDHDLGEFRVTTASTAFNAYRHRFMPVPIFIHAEEEATEQERKAYHGGRVECLFSGTIKDTKIYYLDINSMYGYVMRNHTYPRSLLKYGQYTSLDMLSYWMQKYACIADVTISPTEPLFPYKPLPHQAQYISEYLSDHYGHEIKVTDSLIYPIGTFRTTLTTPELQIAIDRGWIKQVHWIAKYLTDYLFSDYVDFFYNARLNYRKDGNEPFSQIAKLYVNALYGKFGQIATQQIEIGDCDPHVVKISDGRSLDTGEKFTLTWLGGKIIKTIRQGEAYDSFVAIAAHVTSYARLYLHSIIDMVGEKHIFYCDTDSVIVDQYGYDALKHLLDDTRLGALKIETEANDLTVLAPKDYMMGTRVRTKGVNLSALWYDKNTITQTQWSGIKGMIRRGDVSHYTTYPIVKQLQRVVTSGVIGEDGFVSPFNLDEMW